MATHEYVDIAGSNPVTPTSVFACQRKFCKINKPLHPKCTFAASAWPLPLTCRSMSTHDQLLSVALHGTAMRCAAERRNLAESIAELCEIAGGRDDILAEAAGIQAGSWFAWPSTHVGHELVAAGMLIMAMMVSRSTTKNWSAGHEWVTSVE